ncbi:hypothetical protein [Microbacterium karelineae]|uniref:hypothetical protein n=1 Tax=Microbacterium karelineae TaxID=2654283 RepID=UPI0012EAC0A4|nr:hypothetical protein [Microbacterium karelineae]
MSVTGQTLSEALGWLALLVVIVAAACTVVVLIARRSGTGDIALRATRGLATAWLFLCVVGVGFAVYNTFLASTIAVEAPLPELVASADLCATAHDPAAGCAVHATDGWFEVESPSPGARAALFCGLILKLIGSAVPAAALLALANRALAGRPFDGHATRWIAASALAIVVFGTLSPLMTQIGSTIAAGEALDTATSTLRFALSVPFWPVLAGLALVCLAKVFARGARLASENLRLQRDTEGLV